MLNRIYGNNSTLSEGISSVSLHNSIKASLNPTKSFLFNDWFPWELTIYSLLGIIAGIFIFRLVSTYIKQGYIISLLILLLSSNLFPWYHHVFYYMGGLLQSTIRMYLIPQVVLTYIFALFVGKLMYKLNDNPKIICSIGIVLLVLLIQVGYIHIFHDQQSITVNHKNGIFTSRMINRPDSSYTNYYPDVGKDMSIITKDNGLVYSNNKTYNMLHCQPLDNGNFVFDNNVKLNKLNVPFLYYHGIKYNCYLNGKYIKSYPSKDQLLTIHNVPKGLHRIHINIPLTKTDVVARTLTVMSVVIWIIIGVKHVKERDHVVN